MICLVAFLSFIAAAQDFASYQSDGMLLEAGFISLFLSPAGLAAHAGELIPTRRLSRQPLTAYLADVQNLLRIGNRQDPGQ